MFWLGLGAWALWLGLQGQLQADVNGAWLAGLALVGWLWMKRLYPQGLVALCLVSALIWQGPVATWRGGRALNGFLQTTKQALVTADADESRRIWVEGRLMQRSLDKHQKVAQLLLVNARVYWKQPVSLDKFNQAGWQQRSLPLAEVVVMVNQAGKRWNALRLNTLVQMGGVFLDVQKQGVWGKGPLVLWLEHAAFHRAYAGQGLGMERMRLLLASRAAFWLKPAAYALYSPLVLGLKQTNAQSRNTVAVFRRLGAAHIFAISGLHVGLLLGFGLLMVRLVGYIPAQEHWVHQKSALHLGLLGVLWVYIALIGFPIPALRAGLMASMWLLAGVFGVRIGVFHLVLITAFLMLAFQPGDVHSLSFRLSFVAYAMLIAALRIPPPGMLWLGRQRYAHVFQGILWSLWMTAFILLGMLPMIATTFGRISLAAFVANLVLVPPLGLVILPLGVSALMCSALALLGVSWFGLQHFWLVGLEKPLHDALAWALLWWLRAATWLDTLLASWTHQLVAFGYYHALLYYVVVASCLLGLLRHRQLKRRASQQHAHSQPAHSQPATRLARW